MLTRFLNAWYRLGPILRLSTDLSILKDPGVTGSTREGKLFAHGLVIDDCAGV